MPTSPDQSPSSSDSQPKSSSSPQLNLPPPIDAPLLPASSSSSTPPIAPSNPNPDPNNTMPPLAPPAPNTKRNASSHRQPTLNAETLPSLQSEAASKSSSGSPSMYESPSPPSSDTAPDFVYASATRRPRGAETTVVQLPTDAARRPISPIHRDRSGWHPSQYVPVLPLDETTCLISPSVANSASTTSASNTSNPPASIAASVAAAAASVSAVAASTTATSHSNATATADALLTRSRIDLDRARFASRDSLRYRDDTARDRYILGCSLLLVSSIVFIIIVSGMTTMLANSNFPQLEIFSDWTNGDAIPLKYGCHSPDGTPVSFPLWWRNVPRSATNLVILFANAGAMLHKEYDPVHWLVTDIPLNDGSDYFLPVNASEQVLLMPPGAKQLSNPYSKAGLYWPPCTTNATGLFVIHAYAIEASPIIDDFRDAREVINRFVGVPFAKLTGKYGMPSPATPQPDQREQKDHHT